MKRRRRALKWRHKLNYLPTRADLSAEVCTNLRDDCRENGMVAVVDVDVGAGGGSFFPKSYDGFVVTYHSESNTRICICEKFSHFRDLSLG